MLSEDKVSILIVDDRPENLSAMTALLSDLDVEMVTALSGNEALRHTLKTDFALVLLDVQMPEMDGFETAEWLRSNPKTRHLPIIFVSAGMKEAYHLFKGYEAGAVDYLMKPIEPTVLRGKVKVFCELARQRQEIVKHERNLEDLIGKRTAALSMTVEALKLSQERYQRLLESITSYVFSVNLEHGMPGTTQHGPGCQSLTGYTPEAFREDPSLWSELIHSEDKAALAGQLKTLPAGKRPMSLEHRILHKDGSTRWVRTTLVPHLDLKGTLCSYDGIIVDISERKKAEEEQRRLEVQLFQSQKLESLGTLAGGVAHDLNNVLAAILGLATIHREDLDPAGFLAQSLDTITTACLRGRDVVKGLLSFARRDLEYLRPVDLNILILEIVQLLNATTLKQIKITTDFQEPLGLFEGDEAALSHALMNLCLNAVDAMPGGGSMAIQTRLSRHGGREVRVRDTGVGMSPEVLRRAVDPFFTTKPVGKGTGLGLATVQGTMNAHGGTLELRSEPGQGTEAVLRFPPVKDPTSMEESTSIQGQTPYPAPLALRILLVDDDKLIRMSIPAMLESLGHQVQTAEGGREALELFAAGLDVDLVILDLKMPDLSGAETLPLLLALRPGQVVLLATGYSDQDSNHLMEGRPNVTFIRKPFTLTEINERLANVKAQPFSS